MYLILRFCIRDYKINMMLNSEGKESGDNNFSIQTGTDSFVSRSNDVFASLGVLEEKHSAFLKAKILGKDDPDLMKDDPEDEDTCTAAEKERLNREQRLKLGLTRDSDFEPRSHSRSPNRDSKKKSDNGEQYREGCLFKRPGRPPRQPYVPDFKRHPERYTCYTLSDVSESQMSEKSNQGAAFAFLEEQRLLREKRERESLGLTEEAEKFDSSDAACSQGKITFSNPRSRKQPASEQMMSCKDSLAPATGVSVDIDAERDANLSTEVKTDKKMEVEEKTFKTRKNVRRQIRKGDNDDHSD
ncbi:protein TSSC4-like isoform X2 [Biomphalaria glabrata]|uniref:U5 small nuclear ribonucleoprotein TSSC4 n=1 Tax=Biomphalaria glabrata TaxID=6526 RepID=A0A9U8EIF2_BIOGL|nr:protein TSSC4-like isoform X2 [Biomphalaria glabrata]